MPERSGGSFLFNELDSCEPDNPQVILLLTAVNLQFAMHLSSVNQEEGGDLQKDANQSLINVTSAEEDWMLST